MIPTPILKLFARSPISPLQEHMAVVNQCTEKLLPFFDAVFANDWQQAAQQQIEIAKLEGKADDLKRDIRLHLPKSLFLPIPRNDLLELLVTQDLVANKAKDIAGLILGRKMQFPAIIANQLRTMVERSVDATAQATKAIKELNELSEAGFRGSEVEIMKKLLHQLDKIEHETDKLQKEIRRSLFELEKELPPIDAIFLYKIIEWVGDLADRAQHVGGKVHILLAR